MYAQLCEVIWSTIYLYFFRLFSVWSNWGLWQCMTIKNNACVMLRYRTCSTGNTADCPGKNYNINPCDKTRCPGTVSVFLFGTRRLLHELVTMIYSNALANITQRPIRKRHEFATIYSAIYHRQSDFISNVACDWSM